MTRSFNELASLVKMAVLGAGLPTGHAMALSEAAVWLAKRRFPVCRTLFEGLGAGHAGGAIRREGDGFVIAPARAVRDGLGAIDLVRGGFGEVELRELDSVPLLVALATTTVCDDREAISLTDGRNTLQVTARSPVEIGWAERFGRDCRLWSGDRRGLGGLRQGSDLPGAAAGAGQEMATRYDAADSNDGGWDDLAGLARRMHVPASDASRQAGAGAGLTDND